MSTLTDLLLPNVVIPRARWQGRKQVLSELSAAMAKALHLDSREVFEAVLEREKLGSTGVGEGVAIPHARIESLKRPDRYRPDLGARCLYCTPAGIKPGMPG